MSVDLMLLASLLGGWWLARWLGALSPGGWGRRPWALGEEAATALEFTLVFPLFLMMVLVIWQLLLLVNAAQVVSSAAFSAARSAIVTIPMASGSEGENELGPSDTSDKLEAVRRAAVVGCLSISPPLGAYLADAGIAGVGGLAGEGSLTDLISEASGVAMLVAGDDLNTPRIVSKLAYADRFTEVELAARGRPDGRFDESEPVTATVRHSFFLNIPYANRIFADNAIGLIAGGGYQRDIESRYTLDNEGAREMP